MNEPITLLSGFRALVSKWSIGHMTTRWLSHRQDGGRWVNRGAGERAVVVGSGGGVSGRVGGYKHLGEQRQCRPAISTA